MLRTILFSILLLAFFATPVSAAATKYGFNDVVIDGQVVEIEASVKNTRRGAYSTCNYYSDNYIDYLGMYAEATLAGTTAQQVLDFCVGHFSDRVL